MPDLQGRAGVLPAAILLRALTASQEAGPADDTLLPLGPFDGQTGTLLPRCGRRYYVYPRATTVVTHVRSSLTEWCQAQTPPPDGRTVWCACGQFRYGP